MSLSAFLFGCMAGLVCLGCFYWFKQKMKAFAFCLFLANVIILFLTPSFWMAWVNLLLFGAMMYFYKN